jgi:hypothetical protein
MDPANLARFQAASEGPFTDYQQSFPDARTELGQRIGGTIVEATAGGLASVAGGGKFENGAVTAAFVYVAYTGSAASQGSGEGPS